MIRNQKGAEMSYYDDGPNVHEVKCSGCKAVMLCGHGTETTMYCERLDEEWLCDECEQMAEDLEEMTNEDRHEMGQCCNYCYVCEQQGNLDKGGVR